MVIKKNMFPLLGIAFVVAIVSTGVFYGLFAGKLRSAPDSAAEMVVVAKRNLERGTVMQAGDVVAAEVHNQIAISGSFSKVEQVQGQRLLESIQKGQPVTERSFALKTGRIPTGMRAISIRVSDSAGLAASIKTGTKVDLQAFLGHDGQVELRTILQDVEVLNVQPSATEAGPAIVTVLARPQDADQIALADSGARIRVTLRNPEDGNIGPSRPILLSSLFSGGAQTLPVAAIGSAAATGHNVGAAVRPATPVSPRPAVPPETPVFLTVQVLGASSAAYKELEARLADPLTSGSLQVTPFPAGTDTGELIRTLAGKQELEVIATQRIALDTTRPAVWNAGTGACQFRIQFQTGRAGVRVQPEWNWTHTGGTESRRFDASVPGGRNFLVGGLFNGNPDNGVLAAIYPGHSWGTRDLIVVVSPDSARQTLPGALAGRGR